ncbi:MAG: peptidyl-prolyl cis-trans isomerase [Acidobacteriota bacterium]
MMIDSRTWPLAGLAIVLVVGTACSPEDSPSTAEPQADPELVVAEDRMGSVSLADLDRFILELPPGRRWQGDVESAEWYTKVARRVAVDRLLVDEATMTGADQDPQFAARQRRIERRAMTDHYLSTIPSEQLPTEEELRAFYETHREERYERPERRQTYHLFKRADAAKDRQAILKDLEQLRQRVLAGESFLHLARSHSDSESRHQDGLLGLVQRGQFPPDFDRVVFALEEEKPSEPVWTKDGGHLFLVARTLEARQFTFEEVRRAIYQELVEERQHQRLARVASGLPAPEDRFTPGPEEVATIFRLGDRAAVLLRIGDFRLTIGQFQEALVARRQQIGAKHVPDLPQRLLDEIRDREIIYQHLRRENTAEIPQEEIARARHRELIEFFAGQKMISHLENQPERIRQHYESNALRFSTPVRVQIIRMALPLGDNPPALMAELEGARADLDGGRTNLQALADRHGGEVRDLGTVTGAQLQAVDRGALRFAFRLEAGEHSPPYQSAGKLVMFRVDSRQEPEPRPLATVWDQVVQDYLTHYSPSLFAEVSDRLLEESGFRLYRDRLTALGPLVGAYSTSK